METLEIRSRTLVPDRRTVIKLGKRNIVGELSKLTLVMEANKPTKLVIETYIKDVNIELKKSIMREMKPVKMLGGFLRPGRRDKPILEPK